MRIHTSHTFKEMNVFNMYVVQFVHIECQNEQLTE